MPRQKQKKRDRSPIILMVLGVVLLLGAGIAVALQMQPESPAPAAAAPTVDSLTQIERVTLEEAKAALDAGQAVFVDVRGPGAFEVGHIPGSVLIPLNELEQRWQELDPQDWIITYCT